MTVGKKEWHPDVQVKSSFRDEPWPGNKRPLFLIPIVVYVASTFVIVDVAAVTSFAVAAVAFVGNNDVSHHFFCCCFCSEAKMKLLKP